MLRITSRPLAAVLILGMSVHLSGQIFKVQGGASSLFGAQGGAVQFKSANYDGQVGLGFLNGAFRYGANVRTKIMGNTVTVGDDTIRFDLPTDVFGNNHYFLARGAAVLHPTESGRLYTFLGVTTEGYMTPFFTAARNADPAAAVYYDHKVSPQLRFASRNLLSRRTSAIQAVEWTARPDVKISAAGGMGSNQGYAASALDVDRQNFKLKAAYIAAGRQFERVRTPAMLTSELEKENISFAYRPVKAFTVGGAHQNILQPPFGEHDIIRASVDELSTTALVNRFSLGGGVYHSKIEEHSTTGTNLFVSRDVTRRLSVIGNLFHSQSDTGSAANIYVASSRFLVNQRLSVTGTVSRTGGQTSFGVGGDLTGNRISLGVNSQMVYVPLRLDRPFQQSITVNASAYLFADLRVTVASFVAPDGRVRYTFGLSRFFYRAQAMGGFPNAPTFRFAKLVVTGVVVDDAGRPVEGAAVHIGDQAAYTDAAGAFMVRMTKAGPHAVVVAPEEFLAPGLWESISAPASITAVKEDEATPMRIVVRRVPAKPAAQTSPQ